MFSSPIPTVLLPVVMLPPGLPVFKESSPIAMLLLPVVIEPPAD